MDKHETWARFSAPANRWGKDDYTIRVAGLSYIQVIGRSPIAGDPAPCDAARSVETDKVLSWTKPGMHSPSGYEVYLGPDRYRVAAGNPSVKVTAFEADGDNTNTPYAPSSALLNATEYFWRVDADGGNIVRLTSSPVGEFSPVVQDNGRILYHR